MSTGACPCEAVQDPQVVTNPPRLSTISYRVDDFAGFRRALLTPLDGETALAGWHPAPGDLGLQLLEWWAYLADILTFYNERIANESYLRTAEMPASVARLVALIGYQPRPAIAAVGEVAVLRNPSRPNEPLVIPTGMQLANAATPGVPVQTFETTAATFSSPSDGAIVLAPVDLLIGADGSSVLLSGTVTSLKPGNELLLVRREEPLGARGVEITQFKPSWAEVTVVSTGAEPNPTGASNTRVVLTGIQEWMQSAPVTDSSGHPLYQLQRATQSAALWTQSTDPALGQLALGQLEVHLSAAVRGIAPGDLLFLDAGSQATALGVVAEVSEQFRPIPYPGPAPTPPMPDIPVAHTVLSVTVRDGGISRFLPDLLLAPANVSVAAVTGGGAFESGTQYWAVTALSASGETQAGAVTSVALAASDSAQVTWTAVPGAVGYRIYRASTPAGLSNGPALVTTVPAAATSYPDTGSAPAAGAAPDANSAATGVVIPASAVTVRFGLTDVGVLIPAPASTLTSLPAEVTPVSAAFVEAFASGGLEAFVEDGTGTGIPVVVTANDDGTLTLNSSSAVPETPATFSLSAPLRLLVDLVGVSRGATVASERLGTGNAAVAGQTFALKQSPLTYLQSGASCVSTLVVTVNQSPWREVPTLYGQAPNATVFVISQLPDGTSQVRFGDGENGARLPTGAAVVATYRYGAGAASPPAGRLTTILSPQPNVASVSNPVAVYGGADAEQPASIRENGPASVLTFGRAISGDDYEAVAALAPGVARARAYWTIDQQRTVVKIYVGDDPSAVAAANSALAGAEDPNRPLTVVQATATPLTVSATLLVASQATVADAVAAATVALADPASGLFSAPNMPIGQPLYTSQIEAALLVHSVSAVRSLTVLAPDGTDIFATAAQPVSSASPGEGGFYTLAGPPELSAQVVDG